MTDIVALVVEWLAADDAVAAEVEDRISTVYDPRDGTPAVVVGSVSGGPQSIASRGVDVVEVWQVGLFVMAGRLNGGDSDQPDTVAAWATAQAVVEAAAWITGNPYVGSSGARIVAAQITSAVPGVDPDTNEARATVTVELTVFA
jgi:hypothetical protein